MSKKRKPPANRISLRLGNLAAPLHAAAAASGRSVSDEARERLAKSLGVQPPEMPQGFAASGKAKFAQKRAIRQRKKNPEKSE